VTVAPLPKTLSCNIYIYTHTKGMVQIL